MYKAAFSVELYWVVTTEWGFPGGQVVEHLPAMQKTWVWSLGHEDPWRRIWQPTPVFLAGKSHGQRNLAAYSPWGSRRVQHDLVTKQQLQNRAKFYCIQTYYGTQIFYFLSIITPPHTQFRKMYLITSSTIL